MPNVKPMEHRQRVVQVDRNYETGVSRQQIVRDVEIHPITLSNCSIRANMAVLE